MLLEAYNADANILAITDRRLQSEQKMRRTQASTLFTTTQHHIRWTSISKPTYDKHTVINTDIYIYKYDDNAFDIIQKIHSAITSCEFHQNCRVYNIVLGQEKVTKVVNSSK